jgi:quercetin dioxygenase-like cupin family protein
MRVVTAALIVAAGVLTMTVVAAQHVELAPVVTGTVTRMDTSDISGGRQKFEAGSRTAWHRHDKGELLFAESGRLRTGRRSEPVKEYAPGGSEYTAPNVEHWHGATPAEPLVQVNVQFGGKATWLSRTTDLEYNRQ